MGHLRRRIIAQSFATTSWPPSLPSSLCFLPTLHGRPCPLCSPLLLSAFCLLFILYFPALHGNAPASASDAMYRVARRAFSGWSARYFFITRTIRIVLSPLGTHA